MDNIQDKQPKNTVIELDGTTYYYTGETARVG